MSSGKGLEPAARSAFQVYATGEAYFLLAGLVRGPYREGNFLRAAEAIVQL